MSIFCHRCIFVFDCSSIIRWAIWQFFFSGCFGFFSLPPVWLGPFFSSSFVFFAVLLFGLGWLFCYFPGPASLVFLLNREKSFS